MASYPSATIRIGSRTARARSGIGLCFGGGQLALGLAALTLALIVLAGLKWMELRMRQDRHATLILCTAALGPTV